MEVGDEQKSEEMVKKLSQCFQVTEDRLSYLLSYMEVADEQKSDKMPKKLSPVLVG